MTVNEKIIEALRPLDIPVTPDFNGGGAKEYITFNYADATGERLPGDKKNNTEAAF